MRRHRRITGDDLGDLVVFDRLRHFAGHRVGNRGWRPERKARVHPGPLAAVVVDPGEYRRAVAVHAAGDLAVGRDHLGVEAADHLLVRPVRGVDRVLLGDHEPCPARCPGLVVGGMPVGGQAVLRVVGQMRSEDDPVVEPERPDAHGGEEQRVPATSRHRDAASSRRPSQAPRARATRRPSRTASWIVRGATASPARG